MKRRDFFRNASFLTFYLSTQNLFANEKEAENFFSRFFSDLFSNDESKEIELVKKEIIKADIKLEEIGKKKVEELVEYAEELTPVDNAVTTKDNFINSLTKDIYVEDKFLEEFNSVRKKLTLVQRHVGYGNFNIISFDEMIKIAKFASNINSFTKKELEFFESIFYYDPSVHGFYGDRISSNITDKISKKEVIKIPRSGHYLFKGEPEKTYNRMVNDIGDSLVLTSGVRSIVKQSKLFLDKINSVENNITVASKSLAPPAYTYHSIADFDVGKRGFGHANFSSRFALTQEFLKMRKLKYIDMRYTVNNKDGVRYEPWHVKII